jgi:hypothetical protein
LMIRAGDGSKMRGLVPASTGNVANAGIIFLTRARAEPRGMDYSQLVTSSRPSTSSVPSFPTLQAMTSS